MKNTNYVNLMAVISAGLLGYFIGFYEMKYKALKACWQTQMDAEMNEYNRRNRGGR